MRRLAPPLRAALIALSVLVLAGPPPLPAVVDDASATRPIAAASATPSVSPAPSPEAGPTSTPPATSAPTPIATLAPRIRATATDELAARLQGELDRLRQTGGVPGASATIIFADGTSWTGVSGLADVAAGVPVTPDTAFSLASASKTFVAALTLLLAEEGRLSLDEPITRRLPTLGLDDRITVRQLLDHTSGLHDFFLAPGIDRALQAGPAAAWTPEQTLGFVRKPYFAPGSGWHYSNTNYLLLGLLIEDVTGHSLAAELRDRFFDPLGLETAYAQVAEAPRGPTARGYRFSGPGSTLPPIELSDGTDVMPFTSVVTASGGAGALAASSVDLARWGRLLYGGEVLGPASLARMARPVYIASPSPSLFPYGLGVQALEIAGHPTLGHSGRFLGFRGALRYLLDEEVSVAVLTNQSRIDPGTIVSSLLGTAIPEVEPCFDCLIER